MKCRNLSEKNHNIIWFGKDFETAPTVIYYVFNDGNTGTASFTKNTTSSAYDGSFTVETKKYYYKLNDDSTINGIFSTDTSPSISNANGKCTLTTTKLPNYVEDTDAVVVSLIQRLSVIKGELWWQVNYGVPLTDKVRGTTLYDMVITDIIASHPGVASIQSYSSNLVGHTYTYTCTIKTIFGDTATISN